MCERLRGHREKDGAGAFVRRVLAACRQMLSIGRVGLASHAAGGRMGRNVAAEAAEACYCDPCSQHSTPEIGQSVMPTLSFPAIAAPDRPVGLDAEHMMEQLQADDDHLWQLSRGIPSS